MEEWKEYKLGDIGEVVGGATPSTSKSSNYDGDIPWITPKDLSNFNDRYITRGERMITKEGFDSCSCKLLPKGSILFSSRAPIGYIAIAANELCTNQGFKSIIPNGEIVDNVFLYYLLLYNKKRIEGLGGGTTFKEVSGKVMKEVVVSIPNLHTQQKNASILSSLDDKIEINRRINENLEQQAQALFKSWFVDFEPFRDQPFVESELGRIPKGWKVMRAEEVFVINIGKTPPRKEQEWFSTNDEDNVWVSIADMRDSGVFVSKSSEYLTDKAIDRFNVLTVEKDTILLSFKLTVGRVAIANKKLTTNEAIARFALPNIAYREFLYLYLKQYKYGNLGSTSSIATAVNSKTIKWMKLLIPPFETIKSFSESTKWLFEKIRNNQELNSNLSQLRDTLLPRLMSGELKVQEIEENL